MKSDQSMQEIAAEAQASAFMECEQSVDYLISVCHGLALRAGWWTNLQTGERVERNAGELIALCHSELSEALEGLRKDMMDDHLPSRKMAEVELADALIRILDMAGGLGFDVGGALADKLMYNTQRQDHKIENRAAEGGKKF